MNIPLSNAKAIANKVSDSDTSDHSGHLQIPERLEFGNGLVALVTHNPSIDIVAARIFIDAGIRQESADCWGISRLVASVLTKGTVDRTAQQIAETVESVGASLGTDCAPDYFSVSLKTTRADFEPILALAAEVMRSPSFPQKEFELEQQITLRAIQARQEQVLPTALRPLRSAIYGPHPYAQTSLGTSETVTKLTSKALKTFHQQHFYPDKTIISLAGNITPKQAQRLIQKHFGAWGRSLSQSPDTSISFTRPASESNTLKLAQETQQSIVAMGYPAVSVHHPDYIGLKLLLTHLCSGMSSQLFVELRERQGLAYEVSGFFPTRKDSSHFVIYLGTSPQQTAMALKQLSQQMTKLAAGEFSLDTFEMTKQKLLGQYALGKQTNGQLAQLYGWYETLKLGVQYDRTFQSQIQQLSLPDILRIADQYFQNPIYSIVGPNKHIHFSL